MGSISQLPSGKYYVNWYWRIPGQKKGKTYKVYAYKGFPLFTKEMAQKLLHAMQGDVEKGCFRLETYTKNETDVVPYLTEWVEAIKGTIAPATYSAYRSAIINHLAPFYASRSISLNEIQYDNLVQLLNAIHREGAGKLFTFRVLHRCLKYAKKSGRIQVMPEFPEKSMFQIVDRPIHWLSSEDQRRVIEAIPLDNQPIFWWLKYHLRRPGEAMALRKEDYESGIFTVRRGVSAKREVDRTKTGQIITVPVVSEFLPYIQIERDKQAKGNSISKCFFVFLDGRTPDKRYTDQTLNKLWRTAARSVGISIDLYSGLKHSTASQMINEWGYSIDQVQMAGQWASRDVVRRYAETESTAVKALLEGPRVVRLKRKESIRED